MDAKSLETPDGMSETVGSNLAGMAGFFADPSTAARVIFHRWFWIGPLVVLSIVALIASISIQPMIQRLLENSPVPASMSPDQYQRQVQNGILFQKIFMYCSPLLLAGKLLLQAGILWAVSSVLSVPARFAQLFNLVAGCSLIDGLSSVAGLIVLRSKGEISSMAELRPALGIDIFLGENVNKFVTAFLGYFTIFELWWMVIAILVTSMAFRISKGKAAAVVTPLTILGLTVRLVATAFQRPQ